MKFAKGFTLVEILVVVVIIGILAGVVTMNVVGRIGDARIKTAKADLRTIESALSIYKMDNFRYPTTELGIRALVERPSESEAPNWNAAGYLKKLPVDPWGNAYGYESDGEYITLYTFGSDGKQGGEEEAADIFWADL